MAARRLNSAQEPGPSCVSPATQLKREWSLWLEFGWIPGNMCDLSKLKFATTFLSSSLTCPATQSVSPRAEIRPEINNCRLRRGCIACSRIRHRVRWEITWGLVVMHIVDGEEGRPEKGAA